MAHRIVPSPCEICGWMLNSSWDHFGSHQGKNVRVTVEFEILKRHMLRLHYPLTWSNMFCGGRGKRSDMVKRKKKKTKAHAREILLE